MDQRQGEISTPETGGPGVAPGPPASRGRSAATPGVSDERQGDDEKAEQGDDGIGGCEEHLLAKGGVVQMGQVEEEVGYGEGGECR
ncbi:hypothetical protein PSH03_003068, partial [Micromonospora sp. PSH03]|uniref:hypothetical protein n=1 Tax=Micromonospora salmantinae TaxID=2911211 RepID=UPI001EE7DFF5